MAGFGLGALGFNALQTLYINPANIAPVDGLFTTSEVIDRVPWVFLIMGGTYAAMQLIGSLMITLPPPDYGNINEPVHQVETEEPAAVSGATHTPTSSILR